MGELLALVTVLAPAAGGALVYKLWTTRRPRLTQIGLAVGQVPQRLRRRTRMAVRREAAHG
ncbi:hypothetical protein [Xanthomonas arboricola]|uniref:Uncharacterized protein n=4 Tax=Xanthomonas arboricola pv. pruni TaxID=69929 RepID=A0AAQ0W8N5_9XANT|nr:hypothetical protein [Xanthomonas arboricola]GAE52027.1 hypothetical protein XPU_3559 [Xanthomonas arboricola pv. pruni str. MAFF 311562]GAE54625.1 hypothetical protein XPR_1260 [Xanthomonas arboricola pv. pruni MAFF 301420]GAE61052.1 hypothetical protein XPN_2958 [Xanthomonas arboricola pv. pruni MAFF 301427]AKC81137.1 hypothetical protein XB05_22120 [Xanthomonas arboricola]KPN12374.1 hypothetical protein AN652_00910 [Xanthomonas arboricola pv. pruni]